MSNAILLYGVPCSGKTTLGNHISKNYGYSLIKVDDLMKNIREHPEKIDFTDFSFEIHGEIIKCMKNNPKNNFIIEIGCLLPRDASIAIINSIKVMGFNLLVVRINVYIEHAKKRAYSRNTSIHNGKSNAIIIDDVEKIYEFFNLLDVNIPDVDIEINSSIIKNPCKIARIINKVFPL